MKSLNDFIVKYQGKYIEVAGSSDAKFQCVDLANLYIRDVLGFPIIEWTNAIDFPSKAKDHFDYIFNTPINIPEEGDLIIFNIGNYGHISIFIEGDVKSFRSFDQNFPLGSPCHVQGHTYTSVKGWLTPKLSTIKYNAVGQVPQYLITLLQENNLNLSNEGQIRDFFQKAIEFDEVKKDLENCHTDLMVCKHDLLTSQKAHKTDTTVYSNPISQLCLAIAKALG